MAADILAVETLKSSGERTGARLAALVQHYAEVYGEDPETQLAQAIDMARGTMIGFKPESD